MKLITALTAALLLVQGSSSSLVHPSHHPAGQLFTRHTRREPVQQYGGEDPQAHLVSREPVQLAPEAQRRHGSDFRNVYEFAPRHLKDSEGNMVKRQASPTSPNLNVPYPPAGSDAPDPKLLPQAWVDKYNEVKKQGLIPDIPIGKETADGTVSYSGGNQNDICSWTTSKCYNGDIHEAPENSVVYGIDDGPTPKGSAIVWNMEAMKKLAGATPKQHLAVHTWSHTLQTTKTDLEVLGDLGWVQQIIYDLTGLIPAYFRPPEGDVDNRVRAIAKYVLGMQTVLWTHDADDWCLRQGSGTAKEVQSCVQSAPNLKTVQEAEVAWASPKANNSGWITLNHETTDQSSEAFAALVKATKKESWTLEGAVPNLQGLPWYLNAYGPNDAGTKQDNILPTKDFVNVTNPTASKGSSDAPQLGNWSKSAAAQNPETGSQSSSKNAGASNRLSVSSKMILAVAGVAAVFAL